jgi:hypothetical protein
MTKAERSMFAQPVLEWDEMEEQWRAVMDATTGEPRVTHFLGNFNGWVQERKLVPGEADMLGGPWVDPKPEVSGEGQTRFLSRHVLWDKPWFKVVLHKRSVSDGTSLHSHPWQWTAAFILSGGYVEWRTTMLDEVNEMAARQEKTRQGVGAPFLRRVVRRPGSWNLLGSKDFHRVELLDKRLGTWSLLVTGPRLREGSWGFLDPKTGEILAWVKDFVEKRSEKNETNGVTEQHVEMVEASG